MKILILGAGQVGRTAADHLSREEANEVTVVDLNEDVLRDRQDRLDVRTVAGNAAHPTVLETAGAAEADIIVALTSSDEVNMMACEVAFTLFRTPTKIARIRAADYTSRAAGCWSVRACANWRATCPRWRSEWSRSTATAAASRPRGTPSWQRVTRYSSWPRATTSVAS